MAKSAASSVYKYNKHHNQSLHIVAERRNDEQDNAICYLAKGEIVQFKYKR